MVLSKLLEKDEIQYSENKQLDPQDKEHNSALYILDILDGDYVVALGSIRTEHSNIGGVYYPIYLMTPKNHIKAKIGIFEIDSQKMASVIDEDGDIDIDALGDPLLFSFVNSEYLEKYGSRVEEDLAKESSDQTEIDDNIVVTKDDEGQVQDIEDNTNDQEEEEHDDDDDDEMFSLKVHKKNISTASDTKNDEVQSTDENETEGENEDQSLDKHVTKADVFTVDDPLPHIDSWATETEEDAKKMREQYKKEKNIQDNWVVQFMKNKHYMVHNNEGGGDCFFATIRDAYASIGYHTTIQKLRKFLSQEVTLELFESYKAIYDGIVFELKETETEVDRLQKANSTLKKQSKQTKSANEQKEILNEAVKVKQEYVTQKMFETGSEDLLKEFQFMKHIQSVEDLKAFVQTSEFWADTWAISTLERLLSLKVLILEDTEDLDSVIRCTQQNDEMGSDFVPQYYVIVAYSNSNHYELISYKNKKLFKFPDMPYDMKIKVVRACIERNDQSYYAKIPDFRQFRHDLGIEVEMEPSSTEADVSTDSSSTYLFDPNLVLSFHSRSDKNKKAGDVDADKVPKKPRDRRSEFSTLNNMTLWRRKLDDSWDQNPFTTADGKRWNSISHYLTALPFKESDPAIYGDFSDDSKSEASKDLEKAKKKYRKALKDVTPLTEQLLEGHRKNALREKFKVDTEMGRLLKATNYAKLERFQRNKPPLVDMSLMEIRAES